MAGKRKLSVIDDDDEEAFSAVSAPKAAKVENPLLQPQLKLKQKYVRRMLPTFGFMEKFIREAHKVCQNCPWKVGRSAKFPGY